MWRRQSVPARLAVVRLGSGPRTRPCCDGRRDELGYILPILAKFIALADLHGRVAFLPFWQNTHIYINNLRHIETIRRPSGII